MAEDIGEVAGRIWNHLNENGEATTRDLMRAIVARLAELPAEPLTDEELFVFRPHERAERGSASIAKRSAAAGIPALRPHAVAASDTLRAVLASAVRARRLA